MFSVGYDCNNIKKYHKITLKFTKPNYFNVIEITANISIY